MYKRGLEKIIMIKEIKQIKELDIIEKELSGLSAGLLAFCPVNDDKVIHHPSTFLYHDKNIYVFIFNKEILEQIVFGAPASFSTIRTDKFRKIKKDTEPKYDFCSVSVKGAMKNVDDQKTFEEVKKKYLDKYSFEPENEDNTLLMENLIIIDSEELQAIEEKGG